jgi:hypothetical protein
MMNLKGEKTHNPGIKRKPPRVGRLLIRFCGDDYQSSPQDNNVTEITMLQSIQNPHIYINTLSNVFLLNKIIFSKNYLIECFVGKLNYRQKARRPTQQSRPTKLTTRKALPEAQSSQQRDRENIVPLIYKILS